MSWYIDEGPDSDVIISSRVRLARNLEKIPFPHRLSREAAHDVATQITQAFVDPDQKAGTEYLVLDLDDLNQEDQMALVEKRLISEDLIQKNYWHRVLISRDEAISIMINEEDHIRIQSMQAGLNLEAAYAGALKPALALERCLPVAYDQNYGFLTACPTNTGTGMRSSVMAHLPGLTIAGAMRPVAESLSKMGFVVRGIYGEHSKSQGNLYQISNQLTLGMREEDLISDLKQMLQQLIEQERNNRTLLYDQKPAVIENKVMRAYGLLKHARLMPTEEALILLSDLRLGQALGLISQVSRRKINQIQAAIGPASVQKMAGRLMNPEERDEARASIIRDLLSQDMTSAENE